MKATHLTRWLILLILLVTAVACDDVTITLEEPATNNGSSNSNNPAPGGGSWYDLYFTNPTCPDESERVGGLDQLIADDLRTAQTQVDIAAFDLDAEPIVQALIELHEAGIPVRVVTDTDNAELETIERLRDYEITVVEDDRSALMHNKFIVIDGRIIYTGSLNFTTNGAYCNNNNLVRIDSPALAANYLAEMSEMYDDGSFGPRSPENTPNEQLTIEGVRVENYFAPEKELAPIIAALVSQADSDVKFMAFSFTQEDIGEAMIERAEAGIPVTGVFETTGSNTEYSYYPDMLDLGLDNLQVRQDGNPRVMHHKVIIIDESITLLGSFNFSASANDSNDENILIVYDPVFASFFLEEFDAVWNEANP
jgi:phosphatidylserine/phosphatidylglycerophosphate/cardiolipin synthase-like enzyme